MLLIKEFSNICNSANMFWIFSIVTKLKHVPFSHEYVKKTSVILYNTICFYKSVQLCIQTNNISFIIKMLSSNCTLRFFLLSSRMCSNRKCRLSWGSYHKPVSRKLLATKQRSTSRFGHCKRLVRLVQRAIIKHTDPQAKRSSIASSEDSAEVLCIYAI